MDQLDVKSLNCGLDVFDDLLTLANSYKVTKGLLDRFGDKRVIDSPITESGFCGLTVGAALAGLHPVVCCHMSPLGVLEADQPPSVNS